ncbi:MAG: type IV pilin protein [Legionellaceae bacterium]|nr:type IV pilin protein [Legionellaceae bacterium]
MTRWQHSLRQGFSLMEVMIVLLIMSILACFSYPSYQHDVIRARRIDGQTALFDLANRMEKYYALHHTYQKATIATQANTDILTINTSPEGWYTLSIVEATDTTFQLQATANNSETDMPCRIFTLNHLGVKSATSSSCW